MTTPFGRVLAEHGSVLTALATLERRIEQAAERLIGCLVNGGTVFWAGNGGSAADCQHLAAELVGRFEGVDRPGLPSVALTPDSSVLTSVANDMGFERVFSRQVEALCRPGDVLVALSTSGRSPNVLAAVRAAADAGAGSVALAGGDGGALAQAADISIVVPHPSPARVQEAHIVIGHYWCEVIHERIRMS